MLTNKDYCDYETCVALKELGYDGCPWECSCFGAYYRNGEDIFYDRFFNSELGEDEYLRIPLYLAQKWLREEWGIHIVVHYYYLDETNVYNYTLRYIGKTLRDNGVKYDNKSYNSYEDALLEGVKSAIKLLKEEK